MFKDYYLIAQIHPEADIRVIKAMRGVLGKIYHSDVAENSDDEKMKEINNAIDELSEESRRAEYNKIHPYFNNDSYEKVTRLYNILEKLRTVFRSENEKDISTNNKIFSNCTGCKGLLVLE
ncbi:MAG: hypothetical protein B6245_15450 [Desulfobacteraceae bacterium 4572_88]|nr:MAG: hypothetical protein B6245_15450 [Desulfobacteraceae bacterium 4572_88]RLC00433.1 MAG: hypothetical protein DRI57_32305 [Deltaproteobacteria bacterium]